MLGMNANVSYNYAGYSSKSWSPSVTRMHHHVTDLLPPQNSAKIMDVL